MFQLRRIAVATWVIACIAGLAHAESANTLVSVGAGYWFSGISAEVQLSSAGSTGTTVDLIDDLGLDDSESLNSFGATFDAPLLPEISIAYLAVDGQATKNISKTFVVNGLTYNAAENVTSSYDFAEYGLGLGFGLIKTDALQISLLLGAKYFDIETELRNNTAGTSADESLKGGLPVIGAKAEVGLPAGFKVGAAASGMALDVGDFSATLLDIDAALHYDFGRFLRVSGGYRYEMINAENTKDNDSFDINFAGPFVGITGSF